MLTLSIETTGNVCSIAVVDDTGVVVERAFRHRMHLLERLVPETLAILEDAGAKLDTVDLFAVGIGPGSFTGVRVGVMTAKAWADVLAKPLVGVDALEATGAEHVGAGDTVIVPIVRARPGEVYAGAYRFGAGGLAEMAPVRVCGPVGVVELVQSLNASEVVLCGDGMRTCGDLVSEALRGAGIAARIGRSAAPRASTIAQIARVRFAAGLVSDPVALIPLYVSPPSIREKAPS